MKPLLQKRVIKIRCYPNNTQKKLIDTIIFSCIFVRNKYIEDCNSRRKEGKNRRSAYDFDKLINVKKHIPYTKSTIDSYEDWSNMIYDTVIGSTKGLTKAIKDALLTQEKAYKNAYKKYAKTGNRSTVHRIPYYKKKTFSYFFVKDNIHILNDGINRIHIPILKNIRISRKNKEQLLPIAYDITSGRIIRNHKKYYIMFIYNNYTPMLYKSKHNKGIGVDLGIKNYMTLSSYKDEHSTIPSFIKDDKYKKLIKRKKALQKALSYKAESNYGRLLYEYQRNHPYEEVTKEIQYKLRKESYLSHRINILHNKLRRVSEKISNYRSDAIWQYINLLMKLNPKYITVESLSTSEMLSNRKLNKTVTHRLHDLIQESGFGIFLARLPFKCISNGIELRVADEFYPSTQTCHNCGKSTRTKLSQRTFKCIYCGYTHDRDGNAANNLRDLTKKHYTSITA